MPLSARPKVLLADADPWSRELLGQLVLSVRCDAELHEHSDGDSALRACREQPYALIVAEQNLPGTHNGVDLLRTVRQLKRPAAQPFILISPRTDAASVRAVLPLSPTAYLAKPFNAEDLLKRLRELLLGAEDAPVCPLPEIPAGQTLEQFIEAAKHTTEGAPLFVDIHDMVSRCLSAAQCDLTKMSEAFARDPQITACLIAAANSAARHDGEPVQSLHQAMQRLGMGSCLNLVLGFALQRSGYLKDAGLKMAGLGFLARAQRGADLARELALSLQVQAERCYTAALLHNLGDLAVLRSLQDWRDAGQPLEQAQVERALRSFASGFGSTLRTRWRLPLELRQMIAAAYSLDGGVHSREALIVHLSVTAAQLADNANPAPLLENKAARLLRLSPSRITSWVERPAEVEPGLS